jgi:hypothetical protein
MHGTSLTSNLEEPLTDPDLTELLNKLRQMVGEHDKELNIVDDHIVLHGEVLGDHDHHIDEHQYDINQLWRLMRYLIVRDAEREKVVAEALDLIDHISRRAAVYG